jgi:hypothetical protein
MWENSQIPLFFKLIISGFTVTAAFILLLFESWRIEELKKTRVA